MITFKVDRVTPVAPSLKSDRSSAKWHKHYMRQELVRVGVKQVEANRFNYEEDQNFELLVENSFMHAALRAYNEHVPLTLSPDDVWLAVLQAVSKHIELNPEDCRKAIVSFDGKKELIVYADDFIKGSPDNDWHRVFRDFGDEIEKHLGKKRSLFDPSFSTTTPIEKAAIQVQMMSALSSYFDYTMKTRCGLPSITLLGTLEDWGEILVRVAAFGEFYPKWAHDPLCYVMSEFLLAANGKPTPGFWQNFVKYETGSGGPHVNGFINAFYPYVGKRATQNRLLGEKETFNKNILQERHFGVTGVDDINGSITSTPMKWIYYETEIPMTLASGHFGITVHSGGYRPVIGWVAGYAKPTDEP